MNRTLAVLALSCALPLAFAAPAFAQGDFFRGPPPRPGQEPQTVVGQFLAAEAALSGRNIAQAADYYARASQLADGTARDYLREQGFIVSVMAGEIDQALALAPQNADAAAGARRLAALTRAVDAIKRDDSAAAFTILDSDQVGQPYRTAGVLLRPWALVGKGDALPAAPAASQAARGDRLTLVINQYNRGLLLEATGKDTEAEAVYREALEAPVGFGELTLSLGAVLERTGRRAEAVELYRAYLEGQPNYEPATRALQRAGNRRSTAPNAPTLREGAAMILSLTARVSYSQEELDTALAYLQLARHLDPQRADLAMLVGSIQAGSEELDAALESFGKVPETSPDYVEARIQVADILRRQGKEAEGLEVARQVARLAPRQEAAQVTYANHLSGSDQHPETIRVLTRLIRSEGREPSWNLLFMRAFSYEATGDIRSAERDLQRALEIEPDQADVMNYLGYLWADRNINLDQALELLQKAARARPNDGQVIDSLGWAFYRLGQNERALEELEKAVELEAASPVINDHLGDAYLRAGRRLEAVFQWERVLTLDPEDDQRLAVNAKIAAEKPATRTVAAAAEPVATPAQ